MGCQITQLGLRFPPHNPPKELPTSISEASAIPRLPLGPDPSLPVADQTRPEHQHPVEQDAGPGASPAR